MRKKPLHRGKKVRSIKAMNPHASKVALRTLCAAFCLSLSVAGAQTLMDTSAAVGVSSTLDSGSASSSTAAKNRAEDVAAGIAAEVEGARNNAIQVKSKDDLTVTFSPTQDPAATSTAGAATSGAAAPGAAPGSAEEDVFSIPVPPPPPFVVQRVLSNLEGPYRVDSFVTDNPAALNLLKGSETQQVTLASVEVAQVPGVKAFLVHALADKGVWLEPTPEGVFLYIPSENGQWTFENRTLAQLNLNLVQRGYAKPTRSAARYGIFFEQAAARASADRFGLWASFSK